MLNDKIQEYEKTKKMLKNTPAMYKKEYPFLQDWISKIQVKASFQKQLYNEFGQWKYFGGK